MIKHFVGAVFWGTCFVVLVLGRCACALNDSCSTPPAPRQLEDASADEVDEVFNA